MSSNVKICVSQSAFECAVCHFIHTLLSITSESTVCCLQYLYTISNLLVYTFHVLGSYSYDLLVVSKILLQFVDKTHNLSYIFRNDDIVVDSSQEKMVHTCISMPQSFVYGGIICIFEVIGSTKYIWYRAIMHVRVRSCM